MAMRISSCFFSSRLKMRISRTSLDRKRLSTVLPNDPVPPVIISTLSLKIIEGRPLFELTHRRDHRGPFGRGVTGCFAELVSVERAVNHEPVVRRDVDLLAIFGRHKLEQRVLVDRLRSDMIQSRERPVWYDDVANDSREYSRRHAGE